MPDGKLVGTNYIPPDHVAKVTGRAKYAEDFRADGMLFAKLLLSPMPHARVRGIDTQRRARDARRQGDPHRRRPAGSERRREGADQRAALRGRADPRGRRRRRGDRGRGDRAHRASTSSRCRSSIDPLESLRPGGPNARLERQRLGRAAPAGAGRAGPAPRRARDA